VRMDGHERSVTIDDLQLMLVHVSSPKVRKNGGRKARTIRTLKIRKHYRYNGSSSVAQRRSRLERNWPRGQRRCSRRTCDTCLWQMPHNEACNDNNRHRCDDVDDGSAPTNGGRQYCTGHGGHSSAARHLQWGEKQLKLSQSLTSSVSARSDSPAGDHA
jgi:hypothetical protein